MSQKRVFLTGVSSGLGYSLTQIFLKEGWAVYGLSRSPVDSILHPNFSFLQHDLLDFDALESVLQSLLGVCGELDLAILNAGILPQVGRMEEMPMSEVQQTMSVNVWANKLVMDWLIRAELMPSQVVFISSGASVNGSAGNGTYCVSKVALNMLAQVYANENPDSHITSVAPGLIDTKILKPMLEHKEPEQFELLGRIQSAVGTDKLMSEDQAARGLIDVLSKLCEYPSGSYLDVRTI